MIDEQSFKMKAEASLRKLYNALAAASDQHDFDVDYGDALTIEFDEPRAKFVVSPNAPVRQIWVSAHSRSFKLDYDVAADTFRLADTGDSLQELVGKAVSQQLGEAVTL